MITLACLFYYAMGWTIMVAIYYGNDFDPLVRDYWPGAADGRDRFIKCCKSSLWLAFFWPVIVVVTTVLILICIVHDNIDDVFGWMYDRLHRKKSKA